MDVTNDDISCLMDADVPEVYRLETKALFVAHHLLLILSSQMATISLATPHIHCKPEISLVSAKIFDTHR